MTKRITIISILLLMIHHICAQHVPRKMEFGNMELTIEDGAAELIRSRIKQLTVNQRFFNNLKEKFELHAPIIQRVLAENDVPDEFKYLCLMESSMNPAAVSTSNAVGYWQFKKESAQEVGLRVDYVVDERKNIVSSTLAACKYLKRSNAVFNNWILSCQSYNVGLGGTRRSVDNNLFGAKKMTIDRQSHEYVVKFLAYVLLFKENPPKSTLPTILLEYNECQNMSLQDIAEKAGVTKEELKAYNLWLVGSRVPDDKVYSVIIPVASDKSTEVMGRLNLKQPASTVVANNPTLDNGGTQPATAASKPAKKKWWQIFSDKDEQQLNHTDVPVFMDINGIKAIQAKPGDNSHKLANQGKLRYKRFLRYNEIRNFDELVPGRFYYLVEKKTEASVLFHVVMPNESLWDIAQKYGVTTRSIIDKNRMADGEALVVGRRLYLRFSRPHNESVIIEEVNLPEEPKDTIIKINTEIIRDTILKRDTLIQKVIVNAPPNDVKIVESPKVGTLENTNSQKAAPPEYIYHIVEQGQTMYFISKKYAISIDSIIKWNNMVDHSLKIGSSLLVGKKKEQLKSVAEPTPIKSTEGKGNLQHLVVQGETLYGISKKYGVTVTDIIRLNNLEDNGLKLGMILEIPAK